MQIYVGIDTSCYTTSVAFIDSNGRLLADARRLLQVAPGKRGLAQAEMVFQHVRNLPEVFAAAAAEIPAGAKYGGVAVSACPRDVAGSYMPVFLVGRGMARILAESHNIALHEISHQLNHLYAGIWSAGGPRSSRFLAVHASGGTTEIVLVREATKVEILGGTIDIAAGQFIDRIGVALGLPFPAGPELERMAADVAPAKLPVAVKQLTASFAGPETQARRLIERGTPPAAVAAGVQACVAESLWRLICNGTSITGVNEVLLVGGVNANQFIRDYLRAKCETNKPPIKLYLPEPKYSPDNAVGAAYFSYCLAHQ